MLNNCLWEFTLVLVKNADFQFPRQFGYTTALNLTDCEGQQRKPSQGKGVWEREWPEYGGRSWHDRRFIFQLPHDTETLFSINAIRP